VISIYQRVHATLWHLQIPAPEDVTPAASILASISVIGHNLKRICYGSIRNCSGGRVFFYVQIVSLCSFVPQILLDTLLTHKIGLDAAGPAVFPRPFSDD
jgi:hypothetical protein